MKTKSFKRLKKNLEVHFFSFFCEEALGQFLSFCKLEKASDLSV